MKTEEKREEKNNKRREGKKTEIKLSEHRRKGGEQQRVKRWRYKTDGDPKNIN